MVIDRLLYQGAYLEAWIPQINKRGKLGMRYYCEFGRVFSADKSEGFFFFLNLNLWKEDSIFLSPTLLLLLQSHHRWSRAWIPYTFQSLVWLFEIGYFTLESGGNWLILVEGLFGRRRREGSRIWILLHLPFFLPWWAREIRGEIEFSDGILSQRYCGGRFFLSYVGGNV